MLTIIEWIAGSIGIIAILAGCIWFFTRPPFYFFCRTKEQRKQMAKDWASYQELQNGMDNGEEIVIRKMTPEEIKQYAKELECWK